jgi:hypothetical protein
LHTLVNGAFVQERETTKDNKKVLHQVPIYFVSEALASSKKYYSEMEKIRYAMVMSARKLRHYFETHIVRVLTNQSLNDIFSNRDSSRGIGKWAMELSEHVIDFVKISVIKSQVLADFIADWAEPSNYTEGPVVDTPWLVYCDEAWGSTRAVAATFIVSPSGIKLRYIARLQFTKETDKCTNNIVKYETVLLGLRKL